LDGARVKPRPIVVEDEVPARLVPTAFVAVTEKVYAVLLVRPETVHEVVVDEHPSVVDPTTLTA